MSLPVTLRAPLEPEIAPTLKEKTLEFADRIRRAGLIYEVKTASYESDDVKAASETATEAVSAVLAEIRSIRFGAQPLTAEDVEWVLAAIDAELDLESGTMRSIKESSVRSVLQYNQLVTQLMQALMAKR